jgi:carbon storage regulator CsrA
MLILSRKRQEVIVVGGIGTFEALLKVTVIDIKGGIVRLGFEAPADVPVNRLEVWERLRAGAGHLIPTEGSVAPVAR